MALTPATVRNIFAKLDQGDADAFFDHVDDDVTWTVLGTHPLAGVYNSKRAFRKATFDRLGPLFPQGLKLHTRQALVNGDEAAVELYARATTRDGVRFDNDYCWVCRFDGDRIVEVRAYLDSALVAEALRRVSAN